MTCPREGRWIGGCKFEPRYDLGQADFSAFTSLKGHDVVELADKLRKKTYVKDVCVRCGKTVERSRP